jgi:hypothetical protein
VTIDRAAAAFDEPGAIEKLDAVRPAWVGVRRVADVVPRPGQVVFHAGPPYAGVQEIPRPVRHSICMAALFEGWADSVSSASQLLDAGLITPKAAQDHRLLVPLAGVLSPGMAVLEVRDMAAQGADAAAYVAINEGQAHATRLGKIDAALPDHLRWLNGPFARWLSMRLDEPVLLAPLMAEALRAGDDCHARTLAGSGLIGERLLRGLAQDEDATASAFVRSATAFALNLWMGACSLWLRAAEGTPGCTWVSRVGGNGSTFGIQLAGAPGRWCTLPASVPRGAMEAVHAGRQAIGSLGDSAVVDFLGLGGQALGHAPAVRESIENSLPVDAADRPSLLLAPASVVAGLLGSVVDAGRCVRADRGPLVLIGMIDAAGEAGRLGGGVVDVTPMIFREALRLRPELS